MIIKHIDDLSTLHHLLLASPIANAVYGDCYCEIIEAIIVDQEPYLQQLLRTVISLRSERLKMRRNPTVFDDFKYWRTERIPSIPFR